MPPGGGGEGGVPWFYSKHKNMQHRLDKSRSALAVSKLKMWLDSFSLNKDCNEFKKYFRYSRISCMIVKAISFEWKEAGKAICFE